MSIPVILNTNTDMVAYTATTMVSILENTKSQIEFYIVDCGLSKFDRKTLSTLALGRENCSGVNFGLANFEKLQGLSTWYFNKLDAWAVLQFSELFPELHGKAVHVESDTIFLNDIKTLFEEDLEDYTIGACPEIAYGAVREEISLTKNDIYFNLGTLLVNVDQWRDEDIPDRCLQLGRQYGKLFVCLHQDALNIIFKDNNYKILKNRYNLGDRKNYLVSVHTQYDDSYFENEWKTPFVIHFSPNKPWRTSVSFYEEKRSTRYFNEWWFYASKTPYYYGLLNAFIHNRTRDAIIGLQEGFSNYGNSMLDTLADDHPFRNILAENVLRNTNSAPPPQPHTPRE